MELERPPEPGHLKDEVHRLLERHPDAREEGSHSVADALSYWYGNKLPRYLWSAGWGPKLKEAGLDPDRFMQTVGAHRIGFLKWIDGEMGWDKLLEYILLSTKKAVERLQPKAEA